VEADVASCIMRVTLVGKVSDYWLQQFIPEGWKIQCTQEETSCVHFRAPLSFSWCRFSRSMPTRFHSSLSGRHQPRSEVREHKPLSSPDVEVLL
jgi:hypothetical protein